jgi:hypothetical protein
MTDRVTVSVSSARARTPRRPPGDDQDQTDLPQVRTLIRVQARLALVTSALVVALLAGLPLLFACAPGLSHIRLLGIRLPWLILCGGVQPVWVVAARRHVRLAERAERAFAGEDPG